MYVTPVDGQSHAVTPVTIGMSCMGVTEVSYEYTPTVRLVKDCTKKFLPRQHVSAFVSDSLLAMVPALGSCTLGWPEVASAIFFFPVRT